MNWGKDYIESLSQIEPAKESPAAPGSIQQICLPDDPFTILQARYANGEITTAKYLEMKAVLTGSAINSS